MKVDLRRLIDEHLADWAFRHWGSLSRALLFRNGTTPPWQRPVVDVSLHELDVGIGDALMCTPVLRELKRVNPDCVVRLYTRFPALLRGLPYIDELRPFEERPADVVVIGYCGSTYPPRRKLVSMLGDRLGVNVRDHVPDCIVDEALVQRWRAEWAGLPRPHIVVSWFGSPWTPNKDWPAEYWKALVARLVEDSSVIEVGHRQGNDAIASQHYVDLRGKDVAGRVRRSGCGG